MGFNRKLRQATLTLLAIVTTALIVLYINAGVSDNSSRERSHDLVEHSHGYYQVGALSSFKNDVKAAKSEEVDSEAQGMVEIGSRKTLVIVAYHRTGSSLTGALFQAHPRTFYVFEPFHYINDNINSALHYLNGSNVYVTQENSVGIHEDLLDAWVNCDLNRVPVETLLEFQHVATNDSLRDIVLCVADSMHIRWPKATVSSVLNLFTTQNDTDMLNTVRKCTQPAIEKCKYAALRVVKFIRISMASALKTLPRYPGVKIVHLVRDPRGTILSRKKVYDRSFSFLAKEYCDFLRRDVPVTKRLQKSFPMRIYFLKYEFLATQLLETAHALYDFMNVPFKIDTQSAVLNLVSPDGGSDMDSYSVKRSNSSNLAFNWREVITKSELAIVDKYCSDTYILQGYVPLTTIRDVRNLTLPSMVEK